MMRSRVRPLPNTPAFVDFDALNVPVPTGTTCSVHVCHPVVAGEMLAPVTAGVIDDEFRHAYMGGQCWPLALAIHARTGWDLEWQWEVPDCLDDDEYDRIRALPPEEAIAEIAEYDHTGPAHVWVRNPDGRLLDAEGVHPPGWFSCDVVAATDAVRVAELEHWDGYCTPSHRVAASFVAPLLVSVGLPAPDLAAA